MAHEGLECGFIRPFEQGVAVLQQRLPGLKPRPHGAGAGEGIDQQQNAVFFQPKGAHGQRRTAQRKCRCGALAGEQVPRIAENPSKKRSDPIIHPPSRPARRTISCMEPSFCLMFCMVCTMGRDSYVLL